MKILGGNLEPDSGEIEIGGSIVRISTAEDARSLGIEMIHQHLALFNSLDVPSNVFIGRELTARVLGLLPYLDRATMRRRTGHLLERLGVAIPLDGRVGSLSGGQRQMTAIARAVAFQSAAKIIVMDEPSAALGVAEAATVIDLIRGLQTSGHSVVVISHPDPGAPRAQRSDDDHEGRPAGGCPRLQVNDPRRVRGSHRFRSGARKRAGATDADPMNEPVSTTGQRVVVSAPLLRTLKARASTPTALVLLTFVILLVVVGTIKPTVVTIANLGSILTLSSTTIITAMGFTVAMVAGVFDLSVGSTMMITGVVFGTLVLAGVPLVVAGALTILLGTGVGLTNAALVTKLRINPIIATLGLLFALRGIGQLIGGGRGTPGVEPQFRFARGDLLGVPIPVWIMLCVVFVTHYFLATRRLANG